MSPRITLRRCRNCGHEKVTSNGTHSYRIAGVKVYCGTYRVVYERSRAARGGITGESDG